MKRLQIIDVIALAADMWDCDATTAFGRLDLGAIELAVEAAFGPVDPADPADPLASARKQLDHDPDDRRTLPHRVGIAASALVAHLLPAKAAGDDTRRHALLVVVYLAEINGHQLQTTAEDVADIFDRVVDGRIGAVFLASWMMARLSPIEGKSIVGGRAEHASALDQPIESLDLSDRPRNCLRRAGIDTVGQLVSKSEHELLSVENFGQKSLDEVVYRLAEQGLTLREEAGGGSSKTAPETADEREDLEQFAQEMQQYLQERPEGHGEGNEPLDPHAADSIAEEWRKLSEQVAQSGEAGRGSAADLSDDARWAREIERGKSAGDELAESASLSPARTGELRAAVLLGVRAKRLLFEAHLALVTRLAERKRNPSLAQADLHLAGKIGLLQAIERFDHRKGFRFTTYATWWVRRAIDEAIANAGRPDWPSIVRADPYEKMRVTRARVRAVQGQPLSITDLSLLTGIPEEEIVRIVKDEAEADLAPRASEAPSGRDASWAQAIREGQQAERELAKSESSLTPAQADELRQKQAAGVEAKRSLFEAHVAEVVEFADQKRSSGLAMADLLFAGKIGLLRAIEGFAYCEMMRFVSFTAAWIPRAIDDAILRQDQPPIDGMDWSELIRMARSRIRAGLDRPVTLTDISLVTDIPEEEIRRDLESESAPIPAAHTTEPRELLDERPATRQPDAQKAPSDVDPADPTPTFTVVNDLPEEHHARFAEMLRNYLQPIAPGAIVVVNVLTEPERRLQVVVTAPRQTEILNTRLAHSLDLMVKVNLRDEPNTEALVVLTDEPPVPPRLDEMPRPRRSTCTFCRRSDVDGVTLVAAATGGGICNLCIAAAQAAIDSDGGRPDDD